MATPTYSSKRFMAAGANKGANWGTATATGANKGLFILKDGGISLKQKYLPNDEIDQIMPKNGTPGPVDAIDFAPEFVMRYNPGMLGEMIASLYGTAGNATGNNTFTHTFQTADYYAKFFTVAVERPGKIWEVPSAVPYKLSLKVGGGFMQGVLSMRGDSLTDNSTVNTDTQMANVSYIDTGNPVRFSEGAVWMNPQSGNALDANNAVIVSDIDIEYERQIDTIPVAGANGIALPKEPGYPKITVKLKEPRANATNLGYLSTFQAGTPQKLLITFTGGITEGSNHYSLVLGFPRLVLMEPPIAPLEDMISASLVFEAQEAANGPAGMNYTRPFMRLVNTAANDYLG